MKSKFKKVFIAFRGNRLLDEWYKEEADRQEMSKSELIRKVLTIYKEKKEDE